MLIIGKLNVLSLLKINNNIKIQIVAIFLLITKKS